MKKNLFHLLTALAVMASSPASAWDYEGHRMVNRLALTSLPTNFPAFVRTPQAVERIAFLGGEPDRWRNSPDQPLQHMNKPDHFFDVEDVELHGLNVSNLSHFRYEFAAQMAAGRIVHSSNFSRIKLTNDLDRTKGMIGFLPWTITEGYARLKSAFSTLKTFEEAGTPEEIRNAQENVIYYMGVMGHFVGDASQPLHTTRNFNGWVDANPNRFNTGRTFHAWVDGGYLNKVKPTYDELAARIKPATMLWPGSPRGKHPDIFPEVMEFIFEQHRLVVPLYEYDRDKKLSGEGDLGMKGKTFLGDQLVKAGQMLGRMWYSAYQQAPPDTYLKGQLMRRKANATATNPPAAEPE